MKVQDNDYYVGAVLDSLTENSGTYSIDKLKQTTVKSDSNASSSTKHSKQNNLLTRKQRRTKQINSKRSLLHSKYNSRNTNTKYVEPNKFRNPQEEERTLFVGNIPCNVKKKRIRKLFDEHGIDDIRFRSLQPIQTMTIQNNKSTDLKQQNTYCAYVRFFTRESAETAVLKNGIEINGFHLQINFAENHSHNQTKAIFLGNLPFDAREEELRNHFANCGSIDSVRIIRDSTSGRGKGFGYVNFESTDGVELAQHLNGSNFMGRPLRVKRAVVKKKAKAEKKVKKKYKTTKNKCEPKQVKESNQLFPFMGLTSENRQKKKNTGSLKMSHKKKKIAELLQKTL